MTGGVYYIPLHRQPVYKKKLKKYKLPVTNFFCDNHFCPPCYPELSKSDIVKVCGYTSVRKNGSIKLNYTQFYQELLSIQEVF